MVNNWCCLMQLFHNRCYELSCVLLTQPVVCVGVVICCCVSCVLLTQLVVCVGVVICCCVSCVLLTQLVVCVGVVICCCVSCVLLTQLVVCVGVVICCCVLCFINSAGCVCGCCDMLLCPVLYRLSWWMQLKTSTVSWVTSMSLIAFPQSVPTHVFHY